MEKKLLFCHIATLAVCFMSLQEADARTITMILTQRFHTNQIAIEAYENLTIVSAGDFGSGDSRILIEKDGARIVFPLTIPSLNYPQAQFVTARPATVTFSTGAWDSRDANTPAIVTLQITPETYDVNKSITVGPGPGGAVISLECSTNLISWTNVWSGTYTNLSDPKFFRIKADRQPSPSISEK